MQDRDAFEVDVGFDLHHIADLRSRREQATLDDTARLARACRAPRPRAVGARAGELDLHPARHRLANLVVVVARGSPRAAPTSSLQFRHCDETCEVGHGGAAMPVVRTSVRVVAGSRATAAVLPALVSSARLRGASARTRARAGRIGRRDRASGARTTRRPRLRPSVCDRRRRARPGVARGQGFGQGAQRGRRLAARRGSSTLGVPPRMIVMSSWAELRPRPKVEVR